MRCHCKILIVITFQCDVDTTESDLHPNVCIDLVPHARFVWRLCMKFSHFPFLSEVTHLKQKKNWSN